MKDIPVHKIFQANDLIDILIWLDYICFLTKIQVKRHCLLHHSETSSIAKVIAEKRRKASVDFYENMYNSVKSTHKTELHALKETIEEG